MATELDVCFAFFGRLWMNVHVAYFRSKVMYIFLILATVGEIFPSLITLLTQ